MLTAMLTAILTRKLILNHIPTEIVIVMLIVRQIATAIAMVSPSRSLSQIVMRILRVDLTVIQMLRMTFFPRSTTKSSKPCLPRYNQSLRSRTISTISSSLKLHSTFLNLIMKRWKPCRTLWLKYKAPMTMSKSWPRFKQYLTMKRTTISHLWHNSWLSAKSKMSRKLPLTWLKCLVGMIRIRERETCLRRPVLKLMMRTPCFPRLLLSSLKWTRESSIPWSTTCLRWSKRNNQETMTPSRSSTL